jgi:hemerythrin-like domain-containing protein
MVGLCREIRDMLKIHIEKEDRILLPSVRKALGRRGRGG